MKEERANLFVPKDENEKNLMIAAVKGMLLSKCAEIFSSFEEDREQGRFRKNEMPPKDAIVYYQVNMVWFTLSKNLLISPSIIQ